MTRLSSRRTGSQRLWLVLALTLAALGMGLVIYGYWPGVMIDDARWQYQQVVDNKYGDWHPPLMAWIWRRFARIEPGLAPMLLLQLALCWGGLAMIASWAWRGGRSWHAAAIVCVGFIPAPFALGGTVVKDCLMAGLLTFAVGLSLWRDHARVGVVRWAVTAAAMFMLILAAAIRHNAFFACLPLAVALAPRPLTRTAPRLVLTAAVACLAFLSVGPAFAILVDAEKTDPDQALIIFDLGGITEHSGVNQFPETGVADPVAANHHCYDPFEWDSYSDWARRPCPLGFSQFQATVDDQDLNPRSIWLRAIAAHPLAYAQHRLAHFNQSTWFMVPHGPGFTAWTNSVDNPWSFKVRGNWVLKAIDAMARAAAVTPLGWPVFWISLALATLILGRSAKVRGVAIAVAASALLYGAGYLLVGVATGMRYYVWVITGAGLGAVLVVGDMVGRRERPTTRAMALASAIVVIPTLLAIGARLF